MVLEYNVFKKEWVRSLQVKHDIDDLFYDYREDKVRVRSGSRILEFTSNSPDGFPVDSLCIPSHQRSEIEGAKPLQFNSAPWFSMPYPWYYSQGRIRDPYLNWFPIRRAVSISNRDVFMAVPSLGLFQADISTRELVPLVQGSISEPNRLVMMDGRLWWGGKNFNSPVVSASIQLRDWKTYYPGLESGLINGAIRDMVQWNGKIVLATEQGLSSFQIQKKSFTWEGQGQGIGETKILSLEANSQGLFCGTEAGIWHKKNDVLPWEALPSPTGLIQVFGLTSDSNYLWAATHHGLFRWDGQVWSQPGRASFTKGLVIKDVYVHMGEVYWVQGNRVYTLTKKPQEIVERSKIIGLRSAGNLLMVVYDDGVYLYNVRNGQNKDITLHGGIEGTEVRDAVLEKNYLYIQTDKALNRLYFKPYDF